MEDKKKTELFERVPVPNAVMRLAVPTILSSLVMVLYNLADTYFVGMRDNPNEAIVTYGTMFLRGFCLGLPFLCMDFIAVGVFQASGLGKNALIFAVLRKIVLEIPALFVLNALFPLYGLAYAQFAAELILAAAAVIVLVRLFRRLEAEREAV